MLLFTAGCTVRKWVGPRWKRWLKEGILWRIHLSLLLFP